LLLRTAEVLEMATRPRSIARFVVGVIVMLLTLLAGYVRAQEQPSLADAAKDVAKRVVLDPTTYAPAVIAYDATMRDWNSSQVFFANGYIERNPRFTFSGRPYDVPVAYGVGTERIRSDAFKTFQVSLVHNVTASIIERTLVTRYPEHRTLFRVLGWIERSAASSYLAYMLSNQHYRQWRVNEQEAARLGLK
jgi:hypothetical protein